MQTLKDLNSDFFKREPASSIVTLFPNFASSRDATQPFFLNSFFPEMSFLREFSERVFYDGTQRSKLFNKRLDLSRRDAYEFLDKFTPELWQEMVLTCQNTISNGISGRDTTALDTYVSDSLTAGGYVELCELSCAEKTEALVFLCLLESFYANKETIQQYIEIITQSESTNAAIKEIGGYRYIQFGHYPQTIADKNTASILDKINPQNGLYILNSDTYIRCNTNTHPDLVNYSWLLSFSDKSSINVNQPYYYFKVEPLWWRILDESDDDYLLISDRIIDHVLFNPNISKHAFYFSGQYQANSWEGSFLLDWMNSNTPGKFLYEAFTPAEQERIKLVTLPNKTSWKENNDTQQKVFPLSCDEVEKYLNHFNETEYASQKNKQEHNLNDLKCCFDSLCLVTDYSICRGVFPCGFDGYLNYFEQDSYYSSDNNNPTEESLIEKMVSLGRCKEGENIATGTWWLRSPGNPNSRFIDIDLPIDYTRRSCDVMDDGHTCTRGSNVDGGAYDRGRRPEACDGSRNGVRPALYLMK